LELYQLTARECAERIRTGGATAAETTEDVLDRIERMEPSINAYITVTPDEALRRARDIDSRRAAGEDIGPLGGVPMAIKDSIITRGVRTTAGSKILETFVPPYDAHVVERLVAAGAVIVGKANTDEFTMGSTCETSYFGPSANPHDTTRVTGGCPALSAASPGSSPPTAGCRGTGSSPTPPHLTRSVPLPGMSRIPPWYFQ